MAPKPVCVAGPTETPHPPIHRQSLISKPNYARLEAPPCSLPPCGRHIGIIMYVENQASGHSPTHRSALSASLLRFGIYSGKRGGGPTSVIGGVMQALGLLLPYATT